MIIKKQNKKINDYASYMIYHKKNLQTIYCNLLLFTTTSFSFDGVVNTCGLVHLAHLFLVTALTQGDRCVVHIPIDFAGVREFHDSAFPTLHVVGVREDVELLLGAIGGVGGIGVSSLVGVGVRCCRFEWCCWRCWRVLFWRCWLFFCCRSRSDGGRMGEAVRV